MAVVVMVVMRMPVAMAFVVAAEFATVTVAAMGGGVGIEMHQKLSGGVKWIERNRKDEQESRRGTISRSVAGHPLNGKHPLPRGFMQAGLLAFQGMGLSSFPVRPVCTGRRGGRK
ncbi:hypothetical protein JCM31598_05440 [Desulfonatronum parangueonense]